MILHGDAQIKTDVKVTNDQQNPMINKNMVISYTKSLRFPVLVLLTAIVFVLDLFIPDVIPFAYEVILGLVLAVLSRFKRKTP